MNGVSCTSQRVDDVNQRKNYKLLIDPAIKKGHQKIYRFDGVFPGVCGKMTLTLIKKFPGIVATFIFYAEKIAN